jgi:hypothetical protein
MNFGDGRGIVSQQESDCLVRWYDCIAAERYRVEVPLQPPLDCLGVVDGAVFERISCPGVNEGAHIL